QIEQDYTNKNPLFICLLNGAFIFSADLFRQINIPAEIAFIRVSSYAGTQSTGNVTIQHNLEAGIEHRHIILVEDIIDTGRTLHELIPHITSAGPASVKLVSLLSKPSARTHHVHIDYTGFEIPDKFVVGYGMDYDEQGRNLPDIYVLTGEE
ncbi:MAG: hypoxanthine phosphoribosyltransferase, partial [Chitinophagaceae bacterium]|nr:hypoxanthine phosphoribosyltransferase [Chitinophagaceae bacterium]